MTRTAAPAAGGASGRYSVALDVGGTFTDVTLMDLATGSLLATKTPTTPADPAAGFLAGLDKALGLAGGHPGELVSVLHGTTIATNAVLEGRGAPTALLTTAGFRYVLAIGRHDIPRRVNMFAWQKPARPVPPELIFEIRERMSGTGEVLEPLDEAGVRVAARRLAAAGVRAVAVCFLHAYANGDHERRVRAILAAECPDSTASLSSEVLPVFREYERSMATVLNAYVQPTVARYLGHLEQQMAARGIVVPFRIMKSNGGVVSVELARRQPIHTVLSGPAAGVVGARLVGEVAGYDNLISLDVGGTSADICLIRGGEAEVTTEGTVGAWPLHLPMIDLHTIGAGGGSIARVTDDGALVVGPESAGAVPGPACYGLGGQEPTVTDAQLLLGRIPPYLLGGEIALDPERARRAIAERVAAPLGLGLEEAAHGILEIVNHGMLGAIRLVSVERGYDPGDFALVAFGGAGPLHAGELAALLGMRTVLVPRRPGVLSSLGLLATDLRNDYARTHFQRLPDHDARETTAIYAGLERDAAAWLEHEGVPPSRRRLRRLVDLRYRHQGFEITVPWDEGESLDALLQRFHRRHRQLYTYAAEDTPVEIVTLRVSALGLLPRLAFPRLPAPRARASRALIGTRRVYFAAAGGYVESPRYARDALPVGATLAGPAIVEQDDSTTVLFPGQEARVDAFENLIVRAGQARAERRTRPARTARARAR